MISKISQKHRKKQADRKLDKLTYGNVAVA